MNFPAILYARRDTDGSHVYFTVEEEVKNLEEDDGPTEVALYDRRQVYSCEKVLTIKEEV